jgi:hypothetical protein
MPNHNEEKTWRNYLDVDEVETIYNALSSYIHLNPKSPDLDNARKLLKIYPRNEQFVPDTPEESTFKHLDSSLRDTLKKVLREYCGYKTAPDLENAFWLLHELERAE